MCTPLEKTKKPMSHASSQQGAASVEAAHARRGAGGVSRRRFLATAGLAAAGLTGAGWAGGAARPEPPAANGSAAGEATGFYRVEEVGGKWSVFSPAGEPVYLRGLNHFGNGTHMPHNLEARYGAVEAWRRSVRDRHRQWGFNYIAPSVGPSEPTDQVAAPVPNEQGGRRWPTDIRRTPEWPAEDYAALEYPFAMFLEYPRQYMAGTDLPDVFSKEFREAVDARCRAFCEPLADNPHLVGYHFTHNPPWHPANPSFRLWLASITAEPDGRRRWADLMRRVYGSVERWRQTYGMPVESFEEVAALEFPLRSYVSEQRGQEDRLAFMKRACEEWYKVYAGTIRKYDPNHLLLGDRNTIHLSPLPAYAIEAMARHVDIVSVNVMGPAETFYGVLEQVTRHYDGPILLADTGAGIYDGSYAKSTYQTRDLAEFEQLYESHMRAGLSHPQLVGLGWCGYYETPSSRSGIVDARTDEALEARVAVMEKWNAWMEDAFAERIARLAGR